MEKTSYPLLHMSFPHFPQSIPQDAFPNIFRFLAEIWVYITTIEAVAVIMVYEMIMAYPTKQDTSSTLNPRCNPKLRP